MLQYLLVTNHIPEIVKKKLIIKKERKKES